MRRSLTFFVYNFQSVCEVDKRVIVPGTVSEGLNGWSEAFTAGLAVKTAKPLS